MSYEIVRERCARLGRGDRRIEWVAARLPQRARFETQSEPLCAAEATLNRQATQ